jgi:lipoprotein NlpI
MLTRLLVILSIAAVAGGQDLREIFEKAVDDFHAARIGESVKGFDQVARLAPAQAPQFWQRGIALYYAGRYDDCRKQFESHRTVNPNDVENAAWHFLCVARSESPAKAKAALLPVGPDARVPMREVYEMFRGAMTPRQVVAKAADDVEAQFYAHLYAGLYLEATGAKEAALRSIRIAAEPRFAVGGYMHSVARVHLKVNH